MPLSLRQMACILLQLNSHKGQRRRYDGTRSDHLGFDWRLAVRQAGLLAVVRSSCCRSAVSCRCQLHQHGSLLSWSVVNRDTAGCPPREQRVDLEGVQEAQDKDTIQDCLASNLILGLHAHSGESTNSRFEADLAAVDWEW